MNKNPFLHIYQPLCQMSSDHLFFLNVHELIFPQLFLSSLWPVCLYLRERHILRVQDVRFPFLFLCLFLFPNQIIIVASTRR